MYSEGGRMLLVRRGLIGGDVYEGVVRRVNVRIYSRGEWCYY